MVNKESDVIFKSDYLGITYPEMVLQLKKFTGKWIPTEDFDSKKIDEDFLKINNILNSHNNDNSDEEILRIKINIDTECKKISDTVNDYLKTKDNDHDHDFEEATNLKLLDSINRCLLSLSIPPMGDTFFNKILGHKAFLNYTELSKAVVNFNILSMYYFGDLEYGYTKFRNAPMEVVGKYYDEIFPQTEYQKSNLEESRLNNFKHKRLPFINKSNSDIIELDGWNLWILGYLAYAHLETINNAREFLKPVINEAIKSKIMDRVTFKKLVFSHDKSLKKRNETPKYGVISDPDKVINDASFDNDSSPLQLNNLLSYSKILENAQKVCEKPLEDIDIEEIRKKGRQNTATYLSLKDIEVYIATSMRSPVNFTTTAKFVRELFEHEIIKEMNLRYFDPTQSYSHDRIDKGLIECLMIKKAQVTIYNAQESDTFGKDSEAAVSLSERKDVVVYIARIFGDTPKFEGFYRTIDDIMQLPFNGQTDTYNNIISKLSDASRTQPQVFIETDQLKKILPNQSGKSDAIKYFIGTFGYELIKDLKIDDIKLELQKLGYTSFPSSKPSSFLLQKTNLYADLTAIPTRLKDTFDNLDNLDDSYRLWALVIMIQLETRALVFQDGHPLSFQTSPFDGVARGVIITRSVLSTAEILKKLLLRSTTYEISYSKYAVLLREIKSKSPVRVMTRESSLSVAFWSKQEEGHSLFRYCLKPSKENKCPFVH